MNIEVVAAILHDQPEMHSERGTEIEVIDDKENETNKENKNGKDDENGKDIENGKKNENGKKKEICRVKENNDDEITEADDEENDNENQADDVYIHENHADDVYIHENHEVDDEKNHENEANDEKNDENQVDSEKKDENAETEAIQPGDDVKELLMIVIKKLDTVASDVEFLGKRVHKIEQKLQCLNSNFINMIGIPKPNNVFAELAAIRDGMAVMDFYQSRFNKCILIRGVVHSSGENLDHVVRRFLCEKLDADPGKVEKMQLYSQRMCKMSDEDLHRPIYVKFANMNNRSYIQGKVEKREKFLRTEKLAVSLC